MDLKQLRYFLVVASERNFTRAAQRLHIAQPPLSRAIQKLEDEVGAPLLDRHARPLKLTPLGLLFQEQALQMLGRMDDMKAMVKAAVAAERRRFTIGFVASTMYARLPEYIREFRKRALDVELTLIECTTLEQINALKDGKIDVGFGRIRFDDPAVRRTVLTLERLVVALPIHHALRGRAIRFRCTGSHKNHRSFTLARRGRAMQIRFCRCSATTDMNHVSYMKRANYRSRSDWSQPRKGWQSFPNRSHDRDHTTSRIGASSNQPFPRSS